MSNRLSLAQKMGLLFGFMVLMQLSLEYAWYALQHQADQTAVIAGKDRQISKAIYGVILRDCALMGRANQALDSGQPPDEYAFEDASLVHMWTSELRKVAAGSNIQATLPEIDRSTDELLAASKSLAEQSGRNSGQNCSDKQNIRKLQHQLEHLLCKLRDWSPAVSVSDIGTETGTQNPLVTLVFAGSIFSVFLLMLFVRYFMLDIIARLNIIIDNSVRLASKRSLHPPLSGRDEIARLDVSFHDMAMTLYEAAGRRQDLIATARQVICTLDSEMTFVAASDATISMLGLEPRQLVGEHLSSVVSPADASQLLDALCSAQDNESPVVVEASMVRPDGSAIDTQWSIKASTEDSAIYCVIHDITERKAAEQARREVLQMVSHDLRSPLSAIYGFHSMLLSGTLPGLNEQGTNMAKVSMLNSNRMVALLNDLLDIEKMESGMLQLVLKVIVLSDTINQANRSVQLLAHSKGIELLSHCDQLSIIADEQRLVQVLVNLLSNAIKFSNENTVVHVDADKDGDGVQVRVIDQGPGIPDESLNAVFDRFKQIESGQSANRGGSGLGLAICKALVELHGGRIWVESTVGKGTTFAFHLPARPPQANSRSDEIKGFTIRVPERDEIPS